VKTLKGILINLLAYAVVTAILLGGLNLYVTYVQHSEAERLWQNYSTEFNKYFEEKYGHLNPLFQTLKRNAAKKEFTKIFVGIYGKVPEKDSPAKLAEGKKKHYLLIFFWVITPLWIIISLLVFTIKRGFFRARVIITLITATWIVLTTYLPALAGKELRLVNTLVLILVPAGIAWALIRIFEVRKSQ